MRKAAQTFEKHAGVLAAFLGVAAAALGVLSGYLKTQADTAVERRQQVQSQATDLQSDKTSLEDQIAALREENDNLKAQLDNPPQPSASAQDAPVVRDLKVPLSDAIFLDDGVVAEDCCSGDLVYEVQDTTRRPQLTKRGADAYSTDVQSAGAGQQECSDAAHRSPEPEPVRKLDVGALICVNTAGGTSLLRVVAAPDRKGTLILRQRFWPKAP
jgi:cell division protein FtsB